jgi:hypothetical protein
MSKSTHCSPIMAVSYRAALCRRHRADGRLAPKSESSIPIPGAATSQDFTKPALCPPSTKSALHGSHMWG